MKHYGLSQPTPIDPHWEVQVQAIRTQGYTILEDQLNATQLADYRQRLEAILQQQKEEFPDTALSSIQEAGVARALLAYDEAFLALAADPHLRSLVAAVIGKYQLLHLQNGIYNAPHETHHQSAWHRDLPYQNWTISRPIAVNVFWCLDDFTVDNGATRIIPGSHLNPNPPDDMDIIEDAITLTAPAGSAIVFDSMTVHASGTNRTNSPRRAINHVYSIPLLKQQIDLPRLLDGRFRKDGALNRLLGYDSQTPASVAAFRQRRIDRLG